MGAIDVGIPDHRVDIVVVGTLLLWSHAQEFQSFLRLLQTRSRRIWADVFILQIAYPLLQRVSGQLVELIDADDVIFWKYVFWRHDPQVFPLMLRQTEHITIVNTSQRGLSVIEIIGALAELEIEDVDAEHLFDVFIVHPASHVLRDGLGHPIEHALQIVDLAYLLDFNQDDLALGVPGLDIDAVVLVIA